MQVIPFEVNLKQRKLLVVLIYRPPDQKLEYFFLSITDILEHCLKTYEDFIAMGDFNQSETRPNGLILRQTKVKKHYQK